VGESNRLETAITVTGLKPGHFYNVRVIAVGSNNFQAGSRVIRLKTYGRDGRPQLANTRIPSNRSNDDHKGSDSDDESPMVRTQAASIEAVAVPEGAQVMVREPSNGHSNHRRNTGGRKHSPSSAAADQAALANIPSRSEESMQQLTEKFETIRKEIEEVTGQIQKDNDDFKSQMTELVKERDEKRQALKEKEEASEKLKKEVHNSDRANRQAQTRKTQKEKILRDKLADRTKRQDDVVRWKKEIIDMRTEGETLEKEHEKLNTTTQASAENIRASIRERQSLLNGLEEVIRDKGLQILQLEEERKNLPGSQDDEESRERDAAEAQRNHDWEEKEKKLHQLLVNSFSQLQQVRSNYDAQQEFLNGLSLRQSNIPFMYHGNSSGVDFDPAGGQGKAKPRRSRNRKSRTNTISSPIAGHPITDSPFPSASMYNNFNNMTTPAFAPGPYFDLSNGLSNDTALVPLSEQMRKTGMSEAEVNALTAGAPLSPTATSLLPSNIFADEDPPSPRAGSTRSFGPALYGNIGYLNRENDQNSPGSSSRSASLMSSPQTSAHNLAIYGVSGRDYGADNDRRSLNSPRTDYGVIGSPSASDQAPVHKGFGNIFTFPKGFGKQTAQDGGPVLGSLKQGQSQSFPRSAEEPEAVSNRHRRISFSSSFNLPGFLSRNSAAGEAPAGNAPAPARNVGARRRRGFNMFGSSLDDPLALTAGRDPSSPRPLSTASSELPRPSTDSTRFGWPAAGEGMLINRNSPLATDWSLHAPQAWSRNPSRRPSIQHGSTTALTSGIASEDDEFLPSDTLTAQSSPPPVGVIGTRPASSHTPKLKEATPLAQTPKLNPAAPTFNFKAMFDGRLRAEKSKNRDKATEKPSSEDYTQAADTSSPSESRKSRDTPSVHTQNSIAESQESLERTSSNTPSDVPPTIGSKEKESGFKQLFRKGSTSKFSLSSIRGKDNALLGGRKGGSSAANSDRNASVERDGSFDEFSEDAALGRSIDSVTSSPMIGSLGSGDGKAKDKESGTPKEGRGVWGRLGLKKDKNKGRESLDVDRSEAETTGTEDEGM
jgi:hypothetical protein